MGAGASASEVDGTGSRGWAVDTGHCLGSGGMHGTAFAFSFLNPFSSSLK